MENTLSLRTGNVISITADPVLLSQLVEMGMEAQLAQQALIMCQNRSIEEAVEILTTKEAEVLQRVKLEASKKQQQQQSSNLPVDPLEAYRQEQKAKQALQQQQAAKTGSLKQQPLTSSSVSVSLTPSHLKLKGDSDEQKEEFRKKQLERDMTQRQRERDLKKQQVQALRTRVAAEKAERLEKLQSNKPAIESQTPVSASLQSTQPIQQEQENKEVVLQIRLPDGTVLRHTFHSAQTLQHVAEYIILNNADVSNGAFSMMTPFNRKDYQAEQFPSVSLRDAQLVPRGALVVTKSSAKGMVTKGSSSVPAVPLATIPALGVPQQADLLSEVENEPSVVNDEMSLLCCTSKWIVSTEECTMDKHVLVFRPEGFKFPNESLARDCMKFAHNGNCVGYDATSHSSSNGYFKLKRVEETNVLQLEISFSTKPTALFDQITDDVLIVKLHA